MERIQAAIQKAKEQRGGDYVPPAARVPAGSPGPASGPVPGAAAGRRPVVDPGPVWESLKPFTPAPALMRRNRIVTVERSDPAHLSFDRMRTKILRQMREKGWNSLAITSPSSGCGKTMLSLNLAFSFAHQKDVRTVLMDVDLRRPAVAKTLGLREDHSVAAVLQGTGTLQEHFVRYGQGLAIATSARPAGHPAELLQHPAAGRALAEMKRGLQPDVVIFDMPPMLSCDDVLAFHQHYDCALLVAAAEVSTLDEIDKCERELAEHTNVLGVILNKCRYTTEKYGYYY
jgi:capsular exopolysaccharide synthesis family protein